MRVVAVLLRWRLRVALGMVRERDWARLAVAAAFVVVFTGVGIGAYIFFTRSFRAIAALGVAGPPLTLFALEAFFVLILVVGMLSAVATGSTLFFRVAENRLLLSAPVPLHALFVLRAIETFLLTSWAFGLLALPALLALGVTFNRAAGFYVVGAGLLLGFLVFAGGIGTLLTMVLGTLLGHFRSRLGIIGVSTALLLVAAGLVGRTVIPNRADLMTMFEPGTLNGTTIALHFVEEKFRGWPSHAFAASIFGLATGQGSRPRHVFAWSAILPALVVAGTYWTGAILFGRAVRTAAEGVLVARPQGEAGPRRGFKIYPVRLRGATGALLEKEFLTLVRTPQELGRGAFLAFLLLLYTLFFLRVPVPGEAGTEDVLARLCAFSLLAAGYFLTTLALRFVFPALSLEGRAAWILFATPLRLGALFRVRLALYSLAGFVGLGSISAVGALRLGLGGAGLAGFVVLLLLMSVTVMTVALALGLCWPDFRGRSAEALATSGGGLLTTAVCLGYVAITGWLGYRLVLAYLTGAPPPRVATPLIGAGLVSLAAAAGPVWAAWRRAASLEVR